MPIIIEYINEFIPNLKRPKIIKLKYLITIDILDTINNLLVLFIACTATDRVGCIYSIRKKGPSKYI